MSEIIRDYDFDYEKNHSPVQLITHLVLIVPLSVVTEETWRLPNIDVSVWIPVMEQFSMTLAPARVAARVRAVQNPAGSTVPSLGLHTEIT